MKVDKQSIGGCGGIIGRKKGAVAIRINYKGIRLMFISCHLSGNYIEIFQFWSLYLGSRLTSNLLIENIWWIIFAAHGYNVEERNAECRHISHTLFSKIWNPYSRPSHVTIWLGDLNYRLQGIDTYPARNLIDKDLHYVIKSSFMCWTWMSLQLNYEFIIYIIISLFLSRSCMIMISSCNKLEKDKFSMDFVRGHWHSSQHISIIKEVAIMTQVTR